MFSDPFTWKERSVFIIIDGAACIIILLTRPANRIGRSHHSLVGSAAA